MWFISIQSQRIAYEEASQNLLPNFRYAQAFYDHTNPQPQLFPPLFYFFSFLIISDLLFIFSINGRCTIFWLLPFYKTPLFFHIQSPCTSSYVLHDYDIDYQVALVFHQCIFFLVMTLLFCHQKYVLKHETFNWRFYIC